MIEIKNLNKTYKIGKIEKKIIDNLSVDIEEGKIIGIFGKSGLGKTTLFRILAGIEKEDSGLISKIDNVSYCFQENRLLPWQSVYENLFLIVKDEEKIDKWLSDFGIIELKHKNVYKLSGGEKRKVALIRSLICDARLILLDEPFNGIDNRSKEKIINHIRKYQKENNKTILIISHDVDDLVSISDEIIVLSKGMNIKDKIKITNENIEEIKERIIV